MRYACGGQLHIRQLCTALYILEANHLNMTKYIKKIGPTFNATRFSIYKY